MDGCKNERVSNPSSHTTKPTPQQHHPNERERTNDQTKPQKENPELTDSRLAPITQNNQKPYEKDTRTTHGDVGHVPDGAVVPDAGDRAGGVDPDWGGGGGRRGRAEDGGGFACELGVVWREIRGLEGLWVESGVGWAAGWGS